MNIDGKDEMNFYPSGYQPLDFFFFFFIVLFIVFSNVGNLPLGIIVKCCVEDVGFDEKCPLGR